jgi:predicted TIM-barrel fold metal-dependent hydrolase
MLDQLRARQPIIDAHHHIWDLELGKHPWLAPQANIPFRYGDTGPIKRTYMPADFRRDAAGFRLVGSVYVETEWEMSDPVGETRWVHDVAAREGLPNAVVAQAWLDRDDAAEVLAAQATFPLVRSVRHKPKAALILTDAVRGEPGSMDCPRWRQGYGLLARHGLHFDLQTPWWHFDAAADLARDFPSTQIIVNHMGLPSERSRSSLAGWRLALEKLARYPNVALKISGIGVPGRAWTAESNGPIVLDAIRIFGADRCMIASNFPVDRLVATYAQIFDGFLAITAHLPADDRQRLFHDTAARIYRI